MIRWLQRWFEAVVSALVYSIVESCGLPSAHRQPNRVVNFVLRQHANMPDFLRWPLLGLTLAFDLAGGIYFLGCFHRLGNERRKVQMELWRQSPLGPCRDMLRFYDSLTILAWAEGDLPAVNEPPAFPPFAQAPAVQIGGARHQVGVIGSGPGGAITAALLAENGFQVTLIEEGAEHGTQSCRPFSVAEMLQKYRNGGLTPALGKPKVAYVEGNCVGGGSEINSGLYHRTPPEMLARWRQEFDLQVDDNELLPHYEACEKDVSVGLMPGCLPRASLKLHEGAQALGWASREVPRWFAYDGGSDEAGTPTGHRQSMSRTFVRRFLDAGGSLHSGMRCERVSRNGGGFRIHARERSGAARDFECENLFVSGGAIGTPALLQRSGVPGNFGPGLQMHPTVKIVAMFDDEVNSERMGVPVHQVKEFAPDFSFGCSISSLPYLSLALLDHPTELPKLAESWKRMAIYYAMIVPQGRGSVRALPGCRDPLVRFALTPADLRMLSTAMRRLGQLLFAAGAVRLFPSVSGLGAFESESDLRRLPGALPASRANLMTIHLFSSCPMGENADKCSVDSFGRVKSTPGLHVADASLLPTAPGVNPQGSIMAFTRRNALQFAATQATTLTNRIIT